MRTSLQIIRNIIILLIIISLIGIFILYIHNVFTYLDFKTIFFLLQNNINVFKLRVNTHDLGSNYIDAMSLELLILELKDQLG